MRHSLRHQFSIADPAASFVVLALVFGAAFGVAIPPGQAPDEAAHLFSAYLVSEGAFGPEVRHGVPTASVPRWVKRTDYAFRSQLFHIPSWKPKTKFPGATFRAIEEVPASRADAQFKWVYSPLSYAPQATALAAARTAGASRAMQFYAGRFGGLLVFVVLVAAAIRLTPILKEVFWILGLTPMALALAASYSADAITIAVAWLFTALVLRAAYGPRGERRHAWTAGMCTLAAVLALSKYAYLPVVLLVLVIPADRWPSAAARWRSVAAVIGAGVLAMGAWFLVRGSPDVAPAVAHSRSLSALWLEPGRLGADILRATWHHAAFYRDSMVGRLGHLDVPIASWVVAFHWYGAFALAVVTGYPGFAPGAARRALPLVVAAGIFVLIQAVAVLRWSGEEAIGIGFQGRYLLPAAPAALTSICLGQLALGASLRVWLRRILPPVAAVALYSSLRLVMQRYYEPSSSPAVLKLWEIVREFFASCG